MAGQTGVEPICVGSEPTILPLDHCPILAGQTGIEPVASWFKANRLANRPLSNMGCRGGVEPHSFRATTEQATVTSPTHALFHFQITIRFLHYQRKSL